MRVSHLLSPAVMGGAERVVLAGASALQHQGAQVVLRLLREDRDTAAAGAMATEATALGLPVELIDMEGRIDARALGQLSEAIGDDQVVHAHGYKALTYASLACRQPHQRLFATFHGTTSHTPDVQRWERLERALFSATRRVFVPSLATATSLRGLGVDEARMVVVENPVALKPLERRQPRPERLLFLGRLSPEKGLEVLLAALAGVAPELELDVVGDGPERARLTALAGSLGLGQRVRFHGLHRDVTGFLSTAGALVLPSWREGLPIAVLEARVSGLPVLASRVGGVPEVVRDGVDGLLIAPGDGAGWARALTRYQSSWEQLSAAAQEAAAATRERFSPGRWATRTMDTYLEASA